MEELRDVILHVLRSAGPQPVGRTMLVKLVYFAELSSWSQDGRPLTGTPFRLWHYGAYAPEVHHMADAMPELVSHKRFPGFDLAEHRYSLEKGVENDLPPITPLAESIIVDVCRRYSRMTAKAIGALSKETEPVRKAQPGRRLDLSVVAPKRPGVRIENPAIRAAAARIDDSVIGSSEQRAAVDEQEFAAMRPYRTRAASELDKTA